MVSNVWPFRVCFLRLEAAQRIVTRPCFHGLQVSRCYIRICDVASVMQSHTPCDANKLQNVLQCLPAWMHVCSHYVRACKHIRESIRWYGVFEQCVCAYIYVYTFRNKHLIDVCACVSWCFVAACGVYMWWHDTRTPLTSPH